MASKNAVFNLRDRDGDLFFLVKEKLEMQFGPLSNSQVIRTILMGEAKKLHIRFSFKEEEQ